MTTEETAKTINTTMKKRLSAQKKQKNEKKMMISNSFSTYPILF